MLRFLPKDSASRGRRHPIGAPSGGYSAIPGSSRLTRSTSSRGRTTCRSSHGSGPTQRRCLKMPRTALPSGARENCLSTGGMKRPCYPVQDHPLFRWRMSDAHKDSWGGMRRIASERPELLKQMLADVAKADRYLQATWRSCIPGSALGRRGPGGIGMMSRSVWSTCSGQAR